MTLDSGNTIDWGKTSDDYSLYRSGMPDSYFRKLSEHGIGEEKQKILDLGTGTGDLAGEFSRNGSIVSGIDISEEQILMAQKLMHEQDLNIDFQVSSAESLPFNDDSFDCATANQCFLYFDTNKALAEIKRVLKPNGVIVISVPFIGEYHTCPHDYWRFTHEGLLELLKNYSNIKIVPDVSRVQCLVSFFAHFIRSKTKVGKIKWIGNILIVFLNLFGLCFKSTKYEYKTGLIANSFIVSAQKPISPNLNVE